MTADHRSPTRDPNQQEQSYPLVSIVQLVTFCVALVTCIDFKKFATVLAGLRHDNLLEVVAAIVAVGLAGFVLGSTVGLGQIRKWRGLLLCGATGASVSMLVLATFTAPASPTQALAASLLPLITTLILRARTP